MVVVGRKNSQVEWPKWVTILHKIVVCIYAYVLIHSSFPFFLLLPGPFCLSFFFLSCPSFPPVPHHFTVNILFLSFEPFSYLPFSFFFLLLPSIFRFLLFSYLIFSSYSIYPSNHSASLPPFTSSIPFPPPFFSVFPHLFIHFLFNTFFFPFLPHF